MVKTLVNMCQLEVNLCERWSCHNWTCQVSRDVVPCSTSLPDISRIVAQMQRWKREHTRVVESEQLDVIGYLRSSKMQWIGAWRSTIWRFSLEFIFLRFQLFAACGWENLQVRLTSNTQGALRVTHKVSSDSAKEACNILFQVTDHFHFISYHFPSFPEIFVFFLFIFELTTSWHVTFTMLAVMEPVRPAERERFSDNHNHHTHLHFRNSKTWPNTQVCRIPCRVNVVIVVG